MKLPPASRLRYYGLTAEQYVELWEEQDGRCLICEKKFTLARRACIDHDHKTWTVRGLLCAGCNWALGERHDNADWFRRAAHYLTHPPAYILWGEEAPRLQDAPPIMENDYGQA